jgi:hypothetical protein
VIAPAIERVGVLRPLYRRGSHCPACQATAWIVGRSSAECARCATALPLAPEARSTSEVPA